MTASPDISGLSDQELAARCKRNRAEEWLHQSGCVGGLLAGVAAGVTVLIGAAAVASWDWCFAAYLGFMAFFVTGLCTFSLCEGLSRFRCRRYLRELEGRYGLLPLKDYVKATRPGLAAGETVFVFIGQGLPHGDHWWVCVHTLDGGKTGKAEARRVAPEGTDGKSLQSPSARVRAVARWCVGTATVVGMVGFFAGFVGPILLRPDSPQGPLLGIFFTGPLGTVVGAVLGALLGVVAATPRARV
jgi:hypothetical protein